MCSKHRSHVGQLVAEKYQPTSHKHASCPLVPGSTMTCGLFSTNITCVCESIFYHDLPSSSSKDSNQVAADVPGSTVLYSVCQDITKIHYDGDCRALVTGCCPYRNPYSALHNFQSMEEALYHLLGCFLRHVLANEQLYILSCYNDNIGKLGNQCRTCESGYKYVLKWLFYEINY